MASSPTADINVRDARDDEAEAVADLVRELAEGEAVESGVDAAQVLAYRDHPGSGVLVAELDGRPAGALTYFIRPGLFHGGSWGYGDALIDYECEALFMKRQGRDYNISYPVSTIYSEHKVVIVDKNVGSKERALVQAFVDFLWTPEAQRAFAEFGFRSVDDAINAAHTEFEPIPIPFTIDYLGGWAAAKSVIIDGIYAKMRE